MKTKEREMLAIANDEWFEGSLIEEEYQYCRWDAKDDDCIVEFKHRNKHYGSWRRLGCRNMGSFYLGVSRWISIRSNSTPVFCGQFW